MIQTEKGDSKSPEGHAEDARRSCGQDGQGATNGVGTTAGKAQPEASGPNHRAGREVASTQRGKRTQEEEEEEVEASG